MGSWSRICFCSAFERAQQRCCTRIRIFSRTDGKALKTESRGGREAHKRKKGDWQAGEDERQMGGWGEQDEESGGKEEKGERSGEGQRDKDRKREMPRRDHKTLQENL